MSIMQDVMNQKNWRIKESINRNNERNQYPDDLADKVVKYCPQCSRCWEKQRSGMSGNGTIRPTYYYIDYPSYGKDHVLCDECQDIRKICDICDTDKPIIQSRFNYESNQMEEEIVLTKQDGIWVCDKCDKKYPKEKS